jgi:hypothetical protein
MTNRVTLDSMIKRADFGQQAEAAPIELSTNLTIEQVSGTSPYARLLRKPDFQRETNHWSPLQTATLIKSFATGELIPSLILWKSNSYIFVIDGGHRLSALRAWVLNDYGDGSTSLEFFGGEISNLQRKKAKETRALVEGMVGRYSDLKSLTDAELDLGTQNAILASTVISRSLHVQWIQGSSDVAESSFFKINSQGTALDDVEELLLKNRRKSYAIAARSIVRSGTGHKYWSEFTDLTRQEIEELSNKIHTLFLKPEVDEPVKTLDLPLGGNASPVDAIKMLVDMLAIVDGKLDPKKAMSSTEMPEDTDGAQTIKILKKFLKIGNRMTGNDPSSLGLHPAVYFYTERGKHSRFLFLGMLKALAKHINDNDKTWFEKFTNARKEIEDLLISGKILINQGLANVSSNQRIERVAKLINGLVALHTSGTPLENNHIISLLELKGEPGSLQPVDYAKDFSSEVKSAIFLKAAINSAISCSICGGLLNPTLSASYDHIVPKAAGGDGQLQNGSLTHPFCNTGVKGGG